MLYKVKWIRMAELKFKLNPVDEKQERTYRKGSKYDPILDAFIASNENLSTISVDGKDANYLRTQLNKRIESRKLSISVSVVNDILYIEKPT